jgi:hypothetical protein
VDRPHGEEWRITECLREQYNTDFEENETLRDLEEDDWINSETRRGSGCQNLHKRTNVIFRINNDYIPKRY